MRLSSRSVFFGCLIAVVLIKAWLALQLPLFGDEAFYWVESRHPAWAYADVPGLTPWLMALGTAVGGDTPLGLRWPFLLIAGTLPLLVVRWARVTGAGELAWQAGVMSMALPLAAGLGAIALPDVALTALTLATAIALEQALRLDRRRDFLIFGLALALGWLSHYRFVMTYVAGAIFLLGTIRGRSLLRKPAFWWSQAIAGLGVLPTVLFNLHHDWAGLRFQFVERHPWTFHAEALREPLIQAAVATPLLFAVMVIGMIVAVRRARTTGAPWDLVASLSGGLLAAYLILDLFADDQRVRFHWPLPAYLLAMPIAAELLRQWRMQGRALGWVARLTVPLGALGTLVLFATLWLSSLPATAQAPLLGRAIPDNLRGWNQIGDWASKVLARAPGATPIADNFMLGAELEFTLPGNPLVHVLAHPLNRKHGRAQQLQLLRRDESQLHAHPWTQGILFVEETASLEIARVPHYHELCARFGGMRRIDEIALFAGRWRVVAFAVGVKGANAGGSCDIPAFAEIDMPVAYAEVEVGALNVSGWAIDDDAGVARVEVLIDGSARATARYGLAYPGVRGQWPMSSDPDHPNVGFQAAVPTEYLTAGTHELAVRVTSRDGAIRELAQRSISVAPDAH